MRRCTIGQRRSNPRAAALIAPIPKTWTPERVQTVERVQDDNPMWGKAKIVVLMAREGLVTPGSTVGHILKSLIQQSVVTPVPTLRPSPAADASG